MYKVIFITASVVVTREVSITPVIVFYILHSQISQIHTFGTQSLSVIKCNGTDVQATCWVSLVSNAYEMK